MRFLTERTLAAMLAVASILSWTATRVIAHYGAAESPLQEFYVQGLTRTLSEASALMAVTALICSAYAFVPAFRRRIDNATAHASNYLRTCSLPHYALISFSASAALLFILNAPGIIYGTFLIDDYKMYAIATERSVWELFWLPINDHVIPLFWIELKAIFSVIGPNPPFLNFPLFFPAIVAIGGAALLLRTLGFGSSTLIIFLGTFATTSIVGHQLYGFYAVAPYFQVLALFTLSLISFVRSQQSPRFAHSYLVLSLALIAMTLFLESGGVWTPIAYAFFAYAFHVLDTQGWNLRSFLQKHVWTLIAASAITLAYVAYLVALPRYTSESFIGFDRLPLSFHTLVELYHVITAGTLLSLFAPRLGLIVSQPSLADLIVPWHTGMFLLFSSFTVLVFYAWRRGGDCMRVLVPYFTLIMLGTALLVAIARPSSNPAAFYRDQNLLFPLFFLALALTVCLHEWMHNATDEAARRSRAIAVAAFLVIVFMSQHLFSFYKELYRNDIAYYRSLVARMRETITPALNGLAASAESPLMVPSVSGFFLANGYHQIPELSAFSTFIGVDNVVWLPIYNGPYGASTSPAFNTALKHDERLRQWYLRSGEMQEKCVTEPFNGEPISPVADKPVRLASTLNPAQKHMLYFDLEATGAPEKIFIDVSFGNDFNATGTRAHIRLDQYTKTAVAPERRYSCSVDLNEIPAFALSRKVSNFTFTITTHGEYRLATHF